MADDKDPYLYPGTGVLKNRLGIRDAGAIQAIEYAGTQSRALTAPAFPMTAAGFLATHKHLFGAVYDWAGKTRSVDITKGATIFARAAYVDAALNACFKALAQKGLLQGLEPAAFAAGAAHHISEINAVHPFREGNGRAMRLHLEQLGAQAGHTIDMRAIGGPAWIQSSIAAFNGDEGPLRQLVGNALEMKREQTNPQVETPIGDALGQLYKYLGPAKLEAVSIWQGRGAAMRQSPPPAGAVEQLVAAQRLVTDLEDRTRLVSDLVLLQAANVPTVALPRAVKGPLELVVGIRQAASRAVAKLGPEQVRTAKLALVPKARGIDDR